MSASLSTGEGALDLDKKQQVVLLGFGVANRAAAKALIEYGHDVLAFDDLPTKETQAAAEQLGLELTSRAKDAERAMAMCEFAMPTPGLPNNHPLVRLARKRQIKLVSELDLCAHWDDRPMIAITGTNGKSTVVSLCRDALLNSGTLAVAAGNNELPLVEAIADPTHEVFVVEASSFQLQHCQHFAPKVATWLNFAPDHLDVHSSLASYEDAKSRIWQKGSGLCVGNAADPVVMRHLPNDRPTTTYNMPSASWRVEGNALMGPQGQFGSTFDLWRNLEHDVEAALAVAATTTPVGASLDDVMTACGEFQGLPHRISPVAVVDDSTFYDDSKATTPHATLAALRSFDEVVLIAGGQNKGIKLSAMVKGADAVAAVVGIGEAAADIAEVFSPTHHVELAQDMADAVVRARRLAKGGLPVLLSPGCASFDNYNNYSERGDDFCRAVKALVK